jgi:hypothetical protein
MKHIKEYKNFLNESEFKKSDIKNVLDESSSLTESTDPKQLEIKDIKHDIDLCKKSKSANLRNDFNNIIKLGNDLLKNLNEGSNFLNEGRSIEKIQYDWAKLTTSMQATAANWKAAEGKAKDMLFGKLKDMTAKKKQLEAELDAAIADKDKDLELVIQEGTFYRLPKDVIGNELYVANQSMSSLYSGAASGNDISPKEIDYIIKLLQQVKSLTKKFNSADDVIGTVYEKLNVDIVAKKWDELYGEDLKDDYYDIWKKLKAKGSFTLAELEKMWDKSYGESFKDEYDGLYKELMNESLVTEGKTDAIYNFTKEIYDAGSDNGRFTFGTYWKENQGKIIANFNKI